jgi:hypothetical protein
MAIYKKLYSAKTLFFMYIWRDINLCCMKILVGREEERELLSKIEKSGEPELVAVYGRRRVGKTYLVRTVFQKQMAFEMSGVHNATLALQLENFCAALCKANGNKPFMQPVTWMKAFGLLEKYLTPIISKQRKVIFIDEFPWLCTPRSGFMQAFENFWNMWASRQDNLIVVICGSAAAWMIQKVVNNRGGLHNRVTRRIRLMPFSLSETEAFLKSRMVNLDRYQVLQLYMVMGGIPHYLKEVESGESAVQAIDRVCFSKDGLLQDEFKRLFHSLFDDANEHIDIVRVLARKGNGLTRSEIIEACKLSSGGGTTKILDELTESGFITPYIPFNKAAKNGIYKLTDEYSCFYVKYIEGRKLSGAGTWVKFSNAPSWKSWSGLAFESICMKHILQIKKVLGIEGVQTDISMWRSRPENDERGTQIDLIIDRQDRCINVCEMKFSISPYEVSKAYMGELENRVNVFRDRTNPRKALFLTMVTTYGIKNIANYPGRIHNEITMDALFKKS